MKIKKWQLRAQELARCSVIEKAIEGYLKADQATGELPFKPIVPYEDKQYIPCQMEALAAGI